MAESSSTPLSPQVKFASFIVSTSHRKPLPSLLDVQHVEPHQSSAGGGVSTSSYNNSLSRSTGGFVTVLRRNVSELSAGGGGPLPRSHGGGILDGSVSVIGQASKSPQSSSISTLPTSSISHLPSTVHLRSTSNPPICTTSKGTGCAVVDCDGQSPLVAPARGRLGLTEVASVPLRAIRRSISPTMPILSRTQSLNLERMVACGINGSSPSSEPSPPDCKLTLMRTIHDDACEGECSSSPSQSPAGLKAARRLRSVLGDTTHLSLSNQSWGSASNTNHVNGRLHVVNECDFSGMQPSTSDQADSGCQLNRAPSQVTNSALGEPFMIHRPTHTSSQSPGGFHASQWAGSASSNNVVVPPQMFLDESPMGAFPAMLSLNSPTPFASLRPLADSDNDEEDPEEIGSLGSALAARVLRASTSNSKLSLSVSHQNMLSTSATHVPNPEASDDPFVVHRFASTMPTHVVPSSNNNSTSNSPALTARSFLSPKRAVSVATPTQPLNVLFVPDAFHTSRTPSGIDSVSDRAVDTDRPLGDGPEDPLGFSLLFGQNSSSSLSMWGTSNTANLSTNSHPQRRQQNTVSDREYFLGSVSATADPGVSHSVHSKTHISPSASATLEFVIPDAATLRPGSYSDGEETTVVVAQVPRSSSLSTDPEDAEYELQLKQTTQRMLDDGCDISDVVALKRRKRILRRRIKQANSAWEKECPAAACLSGDEGQGSSAPCRRARTTKVEIKDEEGRNM